MSLEVQKNPCLELNKTFDVSLKEKKGLFLRNELSSFNKVLENALTTKKEELMPDLKMHSDNLCDNEDALIDQEELKQSQNKQEDKMKMDQEIEYSMMGLQFHKPIVHQSMVIKDETINTIFVKTNKESKTDPSKEDLLQIKQENNDMDNKDCKIEKNDLFFGDKLIQTLKGSDFNMKESNEKADNQINTDLIQTLKGSDFNMKESNEKADNQINTDSIQTLKVSDFKLGHSIEKTDNQINTENGLKNHTTIEFENMCEKTNDSKEELVQTQNKTIESKHDVLGKIVQLDTKSSNVKNFQSDFNSKLVLGKEGVITNQMMTDLTFEKNLKKVLFTDSTKENVTFINPKDAMKSVDMNLPKDNVKPVEMKFSNDKMDSHLLLKDEKLIQNNPKEINQVNIQNGVIENHTINPLNNNQISEKIEVSSQIGNEIIQHLEKGGEKVFKMTLNPETLGEVEVQLKVKNEKLVINIMAVNKETQSMLILHVDKLIKNLAIQNVHVENVTVQNQEPLLQDHSSQLMNMGMNSFQEKNQGFSREKTLDEEKKMNPNKTGKELLIEEDQLFVSKDNKINYLI